MKTDCESPLRLSPREIASPVVVASSQASAGVGQPQLHHHVAVSPPQGRDRRHRAAFDHAGGVSVALLHDVLGDAVLGQGAVPAQVVENDGVLRIARSGRAGPRPSSPPSPAAAPYLVGMGVPFLLVSNVRLMKGALCRG